MEGKVKAERKAKVERKTKETAIKIQWALDGDGTYAISTGIPFFDHMLSLFAKHGLFNLEIKAKGDIDIDYHHTVEDIGIAMGKALREALKTFEGIKRYGHAVIPMDESLCMFACDLEAKICIHVNLLYGSNLHHKTEAIFKAFGKALREAVTKDERIKGVLSTKGVL